MADDTVGSMESQSAAREKLYAFSRPSVSEMLWPERSRQSHGWRSFSPSPPLSMMDDSIASTKTNRASSSSMMDSIASMALGRCVSNHKHGPTGQARTPPEQLAGSLSWPLPFRVSPRPSRLR